MAAQPSPNRADEFFGLARAQFSPLSDAEEKLLRAAPKGEVAWCGPSRSRDDPANDPTKTGDWGTERTIRAELLCWLCVDREARDPVDPRGIRVYAAKIVGKLDLSFVAVPFPLFLARCRLIEDADLTSVEIPALYLAGTWVRAIQADGAKIKGDLSLSDGFRAEGEVRLLGASIAGNLQCDGGTFKNHSGRALNADGIVVKGSVFLRNGFSAEGEVSLVGAQVGGDLSCVDGTFKNSAGSALSADGIDVKGSVFFRDEFSADGDVVLVNAAINGAFQWLRVRNPERATLDLRNVSAGSILDDKPSWPTNGKLKLDGFVYGHISGGLTDAEERLDWIGRQSPFTPQPYRQLARVLKDAGAKRGARRVLFEMEDRLWKKEHSPVAFISGWILKVVVGYGYDLWRALAWLVVLASLGFFLYGTADLAGAMTPKDDKAYEYFKTYGYAPEGYQGLSPSLYSLENSLPLVKLGQADRWQPDPTPRSRASSREGPSGGGWTSWMPRLMPSPPFLSGFLAFQIWAGWFLTTLFVAGVTGIVHRD
jgi:hypothetical protein